MEPTKTFLVGAGARIRTARQTLGMTQADLAEAVGVSRSAVAQWETDRAGQVRGNLSRVASVLRVSVAYLVEGDVDRHEDGAAEMARRERQGRAHHLVVAHMQMPVVGLADCDALGHRRSALSIMAMISGGVMGVRVIAILKGDSASSTADAIAAVIGITPDSPTPLMPSTLSGVGDSR